MQGKEIIKKSTTYWTIATNAILAALAIPSFMIGVSPQDYAFLDIEALIYTSIVLFLIVNAIQLSIFWFINRMNLPQLANTIISFTLFWLVCSGFILPIANSTGMTDALNVSTNIFNLIITLIISSALTFTIFTQFRKFSYTFVIVLILTSTVPKISNIYEIYFNAKKSGFTGLSTTKNILVFSFDGIPGKVAYETIGNEKHLEATFKDFNIYTNVVATSPATLASLMGELYGNIDFKAISETEKGLIQKLDKSRLLMNQPEFDVYTYGEYNHFNTNPATKIPYGGLKNFSSNTNKINDTIHFYSYVAARIGTVPLVRTFKSTEDVLKSTISMLLDNTTTGDAADQLSIDLENHKGPHWDKRNVATLSGFNSLLENFDVATDQTVIRYMHFTFTHFPVDFDKNGTYRSNVKDWFSKNQTGAAVEAESAWAMNKIAQTVKRLKELGVYDNSLIVLKSDHGKPAYYFNSHPSNLKINNHKHWGYNRYRPMLMIKNKNQTKNNPRYIKELVLLDDLAKTLFIQAKEDNKTNHLPGIDLLGEKFERDTLFTIYVPENEKSDWKIDTHIPITVSRNVDFLKSLYEENTITVE